MIEKVLGNILCDHKGIKGVFAIVYHRLQSSFTYFHNLTKGVGTGASPQNNFVRGRGEGGGGGGGRIAFHSQDSYTSLFQEWLYAVCKYNECIYNEIITLFLFFTVLMFQRCIVMR